ncbi:MAG: NADH-quinone oxidoreductase subunit NuoH [Spirochaetia bacterium]|nr:NADH-quinone oxidoreductase subunit NuoH [Spirochaetia bacterium]
MDLLKDILYNTDKPWNQFYGWAHAGWANWGWPPFILDIIFQLCFAVIIAVVLILNALWIIYYDRKIAALFQIRKGPNRVGPLGLFQTIADTVKLLIKEDINPKAVDLAVFFLAPVFIFIPTFMVMLVIPFGRGLIPADLNIGILYVMAITGLSVIGILMAGWGSNSKYSLIGGLRSAVQLVSYEIPMMLVILTIVMMSGTLSMGGIVQAQAGYKWFWLPQIVGFILFLIAGNAEVNRAPFDLPEAESELVAGFNTEYSAMKFAFFYLAEYVNLFITSAIAATLFLGGWEGPLLPPVVWFFIKTYFVVTLLMWIRWTFPRLRVDHLMEFSWKYLIPIALLNMVVTAFVIKLV